MKTGCRFEPGELISLYLGRLVQGGGSGEYKLDTGLPTPDGRKLSVDAADPRCSRISRFFNHDGASPNAIFSSADCTFGPAIDGKRYLCNRVLASTASNDGIGPGQEILLNYRWKRGHQIGKPQSSDANH